MSNKLDIKKTKYRYLMDNLSLTPVRPIINYTIPVPLGVETKDDEFFNRVYPDVDITNIAFKKHIDGVAKALVALGVKNGDIVTICQTNTPETIYMDYALSKIGAVPNYIYPNVTADEMKYYIEELNSKYMFILDDEQIRANAKKATDNTGIKIISSLPIESFPLEFKAQASLNAPKSTIVLENEIKWDDFIENGKTITEVKEAPYEENKTCSYIHTSGTSNVPKAVADTNENINSIVRNYETDGIEMTAGKHAIQTIPHFVEYGKTTDHVCLCNNVCLILIPEMEPKNFYDLVNKYKAEYSFSTPSHARELIKRKTDMSHCENFLFGGDGFDDVEMKMNNYMKENGSKTPAYQGYGATEFSAVDIINRPGAHKIGSIGKLCGQNEAVIIEPGTFNEIAEPNKVGELCLTGTSLTNGYAGNSEKENSKVFIKHPDGKVYVHMGDYISRDEEGFFYYHGRIKNVITRKSFTFSPDEIVHAIMKHPNVKQCVVVPKYSAAEGETPSAHIVLNVYDDMNKTMSEIIDLVNNNVQEFHRPTDYKIRPNIIISRNNKNNITALKIEDTISMYEGVINCEIKSLNDGEYDYEAVIDVNEEMVSSDVQELEQSIKNHLNEIANIVKFNVGKIKYSINYTKIKYVDSEIVKDYENIKKSKTYVKHI